MGKNLISMAMEVKKIRVELVNHEKGASGAIGNTGESSEGYYNLILSRFCRWVSSEALTTGL